MTAPSTREALETIWSYCVESDWTGWDPYDGLMVQRAPATWLLHSRAGRLALIQGFKRSPLNLRPLLGVPPLRNPKAMALGLMAACRLATLPASRTRALAEAQRLVTALHRAATPTPHGHGWGYPFDWQARSFFIGRGVPTVVCTGFVVRALDLARDVAGIDSSEAIAKAAAFVEHDLNRSQLGDGFCFSYSPLDNSVVVNATLLGAETMARHARLSGDRSALERALPTVRWSLSQQNDKGGWAYGQAGHHRWEDAFHTGFNLLSLRAIATSATELGLDPNVVIDQQRLTLAYRHYAETFFDSNGRPWYYSHTPWPIDGHAAAVAILTHLAFSAEDSAARERAERTAAWSLAHLWNRNGWFDFQIHRWGRVRTPYLRWTQAWMLLALADLLSTSDGSA